MANDMNYSQQSEKLDDILSELQDPDISIDKAVELHAAGEKLINQLAKCLETAEVKIKQRLDDK